MTDNLRSDFNRTINMALILKGQACTNCFNLVTDEILYDNLKEKAKLIAVMPADEVNYKALIAPDTVFPLFRLCDTCSKKLSKKEIDELKKVAFNKDNTMEFSTEFYKKIYYGPFPEIFI